MNGISFLLMLLFWAGVWLLLCKRPMELKERAQLQLSGYRRLQKKRGAAGLFAELRKRLLQEKMEKELAESLAYIKNLVVLGRGRSISAELLLTELADATSVLSSIYLNMASWLSLNEKEAAAKCFSDSFDTGYAVEIGRFLAGWEDICPQELLPAVELYQSALREERQTRQSQKDEMISDLIYFPVVMNCMAVLLNFIYVVYFLSQKEALGLLMS
ncbi:MAG: hypothetical protein HUJ80_03755 [Firmicutes bacterium]|nr:hypothetical protein [Bacillota bacterium]